MDIPHEPMAATFMPPPLTWPSFLLHLFVSVSLALRRTQKLEFLRRAVPAASPGKSRPERALPTRSYHGTLPRNTPPGSSPGNWVRGEKLIPRKNPRRGLHAFFGVTLIKSKTIRNSLLAVKAARDAGSLALLLKDRVLFLVCFCSPEKRLLTFKRHPPLFSVAWKPTKHDRPTKTY